MRKLFQRRTILLNENDIPEKEVEETLKGSSSYPEVVAVRQLLSSHIRDHLVATLSNPEATREEMRHHQGAADALMDFDFQLAELTK